MSKLYAALMLTFVVLMLTTPVFAQAPAQSGMTHGDWVVISAGFAQLGANYGRTIVGNFIEQEMPFVKSDTTVVTIFAGGNDVNTITSALGGGAGGSDPASFIDNQVRSFANDYNTLISGIRSRASQTRIVILNLPNLAGLPYLAGASVSQRQACLALSALASVNAVMTSSSAASATRAGPARSNGIGRTLRRDA